MNRDIALTFFVWFGYIVLLAVVPWWITPSSNLPNTAALQGYNIAVAYLTIAAWTLAAIVPVRLLSKGEIKNSTIENIRSKQPTLTGHPRVELLVATIFVVFLYWPSSLARFGPHVEDTYFLTVLWRIACGEIPYKDFEFLYGPAMIYLPAWWQSINGFSMQSYYTMFLMLQLAPLILVVKLLQKYHRRFRARLLSFFILIPFMADFLLGLNWIAIRYFAVVVALLVLSHRPRSYPAVTLSGVVIGLSAAYSYEYATAALLSCLAILSIQLSQSRCKEIILSSVILSTTSVLVWFTTTLALTGDNFYEYLFSTHHTTSTATTLGLGQFAFTWTLHSLALFFVLASMVVVITRNLHNRLHYTPCDLQLIGATVFTLVVLKISFQRADYLHLAVAFVPLIIMFLIHDPTKQLNYSSILRTAMLSAIVLASVCHAIGHIPNGRWVLFGMARGLVHEITNRPKVDIIDARNHGIQIERTNAKSSDLQVAALFNRPDLRDRPVLFYGSTWDLAIRAGVCPSGYSFYDLLYSDERKPLVRTVESTPDLLVVMRKHEYNQLFSEADSEFPRSDLLPLQRVARVLSSVHFTETKLEKEIEFNLWRNSLGNKLSRSYRIKEHVADLVVLEEKK